MPKIEVIIEQDGSTVVQTSGFKGKACQDATKQLEQALGITTSDKKLPEFYATAKGSQSAKQ